MALAIPQPRWGLSLTIAEQHRCVFTAGGQFHYRLTGIQGLKPAWALGPRWLR